MGYFFVTLGSTPWVALELLFGYFEFFGFGPCGTFGPLQDWYLSLVGLVIANNVCICVQEVLCQAALTNGRFFSEACEKSLSWLYNRSTIACGRDVVDTRLAHTHKSMPDPSFFEGAYALRAQIVKKQSRLEISISIFRIFHTKKGPWWMACLIPVDRKVLHFKF